MSDTVTCNSCGREVVTTTYREYEVYPVMGETKKSMVAEKEEITVEISHRRDFHHEKGWVEETWSGSLCEGCLQRMLHVVGASKEPSLRGYN